jgi:deferrochelatase/peroxidase EfeB
MDDEQGGRGSGDGRDDEPGSAAPARGGISRRAFVAGGVGALGGAALLGGGFAGGRAEGRREVEHADATGQAYPFYDQAHPPGVRTTPQEHSVFVALDVTSTSAGDLKVLLARWSAAIAQLMAGDTVSNPEPSRPDAVAEETGEALDLGPQSLTVLVGLGPSLFDHRFGLAARRPAALADLPRFPSDLLQPELCGGDLCLQACADDPQVAFHAIRVLVRMARGTAVTRWTVIGFNRASAGPGQTTPRNLMGFKDGTRNVSTDEQYDKFVWIGPGDTDQPWMAGGTYLVSRKIQMMIETWDTDTIGDQQAVFGRTKVEGAPLSGTHETDTPDFAATGAGGARLIDPTSHIALAAPEQNAGLMIRRRPYNYTDGLGEGGQLDAGLHFVCFQNDPQAFVTLQNRLGSSDRLNEYIKHRGSAIFAVPPTPRRGRFVGQELFEA